MSDKTPSVDGLMGLVRAYADQETLCVMRSSDEAYWGFYREQQRVGDGIRQYVEAMQANAYAEGRTDESKEMAGPLALMRDAFDLLESHLGDSEVHYDDDEEEREYAPVQVAARYLMAAIQAMQGPSVREETVYEKSARWNWPDGRPDL